MKKQIKKNDLYDYVEKTINGRKNEESTKAYDYLDKVLRPLIKEVSEAKLETLGLHSIDDVVKDVHRAMDDVFGIMPGVKVRYQSLRNLHNDMDRIGKNFQERAITEFSAYIVEFILEGKDSLNLLLASFSFDAFKSIETSGLEYVKIVRETNSNRDKLEILRREARGIISASKSGKEGHTNLVALGFPMEGFESSISLLPAIQQFSVNLDILNSTKKD